jgi:hypothetical protein
MALCSAKISGCCFSLDRSRPIQKEVLPTHRLNPQPLDGNRRPLIVQHKRMIIPMADYEFNEAEKVGSPDRSGLYLDRPLAPEALEDRSTSSGSSRQ